MYISTSIIYIRKTFIARNIYIYLQYAQQNNNIIYKKLIDDSVF